MSSEQPDSQTISGYIFRGADEVGLVSVYHSPLDTKLLCMQRFVRFFAYGSTTLILAAFLSELGNSDSRIGLFMTLTLVGDVVISFILTCYADALGRKTVLRIGSLLMVVSGIAFAFTNNFFILLAAAIFGVISPSGNEVGPFRAVEESTLAHLTPEAARSDIFAWYSFIGYAGTALGTFVGGWVVQRVRASTGNAIFAYRCMFYIYAVQGFLKFLLACGLSKNIEAGNSRPEIETDSEREPLLASTLPPEEVEAETREVKRKTILSIGKENLPTYIQLSLLFALDAFASGLASTTWLTYFFHKKFNLEEGRLGSLFSGLALITAISILVASAIAKRIGNVKAMVFTHLPSTIMLILIPIPSHAGPAMTFLIIRACSQSMDVAPRTAFMTTVILPEERTSVMGIINVIKTLSQSLGPLVTGVLANRDLFGLSFVVAGVLKAIYDLGVLAVFAGHKTQRKEIESESESQPEPRTDIIEGI
ncbi:major facilitator superfamily domain-containing protein [Delphinella strobiligena]|nr:major facilitator superfamily domain-containing protein [Delphinella strobiligena]